MNLSIITTVLNTENRISSCIESIIEQDIFDHIELVVIDGGSTDTTLEIIKSYKSHISKIVSEPDDGMYDGINKGIMLTTGEVVGLLHADDFYSSSDSISHVLKVFSQSDVDACYGDLVYVDNICENKVKRYWTAGHYNPKKFYWGWMPPHPTFFVRRSVYMKYGLFNLDMGTAADYELMLRFLLKHKIKTTYIPEVLVHMRTGGISNRSIMNRIRANRMDRKAWEVNGLKPYPWTLWMKPIRKIPQWIVK